MEYDAGARARLREVEVKVMRLQDDIEAGKKKLREGETMQQALKEYREKLLERVSFLCKIIKKKQFYWKKKSCWKEWIISVFTNNILKLIFNGAGKNKFFT